MSLHILYEDKNIIVCRKPAGIATQTAKVGQKDMVSELIGYLMSKGETAGGRTAKEGKRHSRSQERKLPYVGVIHRLDQPVEGILVFAKDRAGAASLSRQAAENEMKKYYEAVVCGENISPEGELADYLWKDGSANLSKIVTSDKKGAKLSKLSYQTLQEKEKSLADGDRPKIALVRIHLLTGRHHQIRVQMREAGMSLLGDYKYADERTKRLSEQLQITEIALCACELSFIHPKTGKEMRFQIRPEGKAFQLMNS